MPELLVEVLRGDVVESRHYGSIAVVDANGVLVSAVGDPAEMVFMRSAAKPLQVLPVIESGAADKYDFTEAELAAMSGSLNGQEFQVDAVRSILSRIGLSEDNLLCGVHPPSHRATARLMQEKGLAPRPVHNNCAGKHAAILTLCQYYGWPADSYLLRDHPAQKLILSAIARATLTAPEEIKIGIDGCGVPVFALPLRNLAVAYARLAVAGEGPLGRLRNALLAHPEMIAGDERICTEVMRARPGKVIAKTGAEGSYALSMIEPALGVAIGVDDGASRAVHSVVIEVLGQLGLLDESALSRLKEWHRPEVRNHRKEVVGRVRASFRLEQMI